MIDYGDLKHWIIFKLRSTSTSIFQQIQELSHRIVSWCFRSAMTCQDLPNNSWGYLHEAHQTAHPFAADAEFCPALYLSRILCRCASKSSCQTTLVKWPAKTYLKSKYPSFTPCFAWTSQPTLRASSTACKRFVSLSHACNEKALCSTYRWLKTNCNVVAKVAQSSKCSKHLQMQTCCSSAWTSSFLKRPAMQLPASASSASLGYGLYTFYYIFYIIS